MEQLTLSQGKRIEFQRRMTALRERAEQLSARIVQEARETARQAGLDSTSPFLSAHNTMCCFGTRSQWSEVNHDLARRVLWLEKQSWEPGRLYDRIFKREYNKMIRDLGTMEMTYSENVAGESEAL